MQDYRVELESFSGPMDLLLFLVRRDEVDLLDIPIARLAEQYLAYLKKLQQIDVDLAGEFLVMAATLLELKSQMLVPAVAEGQEGENADQPQSIESLDPRRELVQALLAYKRFKDAALMLEQRSLDWSRRYPRQPVRPKRVTVPNDELAFFEGAIDPAGEGVPEIVDEAAGLVEFDLEDANIQDLAEIYARILETIGRGPSRHEVVYDDTPIGLHAADIVDRLSRDGQMTLQAMFQGRARGERVGLFLALLELVRQRKVRVKQDELNQDIQLEVRSDGEEISPPADAPPHWIDPVTGKPQYEWPDEEAKLIALRREKLRFKWAQKKKDEAQNLYVNPADATAAAAEEGMNIEPGDVSDAELEQLDAKLQAEEEPRESAPE